MRGLEFDILTCVFMLCMCKFIFLKRCLIPGGFGSHIIFYVFYNVSQNYKIYLNMSIVFSSLNQETKFHFCPSYNHKLLSTIKIVTLVICWLSVSCSSLVKSKFSSFCHSLAQLNSLELT